MTADLGAFDREKAVDIVDEQIFRDDSGVHSKTWDRVIAEAVMPGWLVGEGPGERLVLEDEDGLVKGVWHRPRPDL